MKVLKSKPDVKEIKIAIDYLPEGKRGKKFSKLSDVKTRRRYAIGKVILNNNMELSLIEVEREEKSLSMLLLYSMKKVNWAKIYYTVTLGLVNKSGTWDSQGIKRLERKGVFSKRIRHKSDKSSIYDKCDYIYDKIFQKK
jgi:hypothetical protein